MQIQKIELTLDELNLYNKIPLYKSGPKPRHEDILAGSEASMQLVCSLLQRNAIPEIRLQYFINSTYNTHSKKSHKALFEENKTHGEAIYRHPHFWPFLNYWIHGPDLPEETKEKFIGIVSAEAYISGSDMPGLRVLVRAETRNHRLVPQTASEEFYKLALECGIGEGYARLLRNHVLET